MVILGLFDQLTNVPGSLRAPPSQLSLILSFMAVIPNLWSSIQMLLLLSFLFNYYLLCLAKIDGPSENVVEKQRFLHPYEINGQVLPKKSLKSTILSVTTIGPNVFNKLLKPDKKSTSGGIAPFMSLISNPSSVRIPTGQHTTHLETAFSIEASVPILANEHELIEEKEPKVTERPTSTTTKSPEELDEQEEHEIDSELGSTGMSMRLAGDTITIETQPRYKLIYYDLRGLSEAIRLIFHYANESFIDERISKKMWLRMRGKTLFGKVPILEVDGKQLGQCYAITRYLARKFGLIGMDEWDQAKVDEVAEFHRGVVTDMSAYIFVLGGYREGNKDQLRKTVFLPAVDKYFPIYAKLLDENHSGFFGKSVTWVDFSISEFFTTINEYEPFILKKFPSLVRFVEKVHQLPQIRHYIRTRNKTPLNAS